MNTKIKVEARKRHTVRNLLIFTIFVLASGWFGRWVDALTGSSSSSDGAGMGIWIISPLVISFLLRAFAGDGWKDLGIKPKLKGNGIWYTLSILIYPLCVTFIVMIGLAVGAISFSSSATVGVFIKALSLLLVSQFLTNIPEECGFRGYLAPRMYKLPLNTFASHILVGLIWGLWHVPYLAAIMPYTNESMATLLPRFLLGTVAASIVYGEIRIQTNFVWPAVLMQTAGGTFIGALMLKDLIIVSNSEWFFRPVLEGGLMIVLFALIGVGMYRWRVKKAGVEVEDRLEPSAV